MSRTGILILLGIFIILTPFSGLPIALRTLLLVAFGIGVLIIGLSLRKSDMPQEVERETREEAPPGAIG